LREKQEKGIDLKKAKFIIAVRKIELPLPNFRQKKLG